MAAGATAIVTRLVADGKIHGIISLGGTQGTTLSTKVMRALPYGLPKVMVSTIASGNVAPWVDIKDITMMFSVADILGLNPLTRKILANAAGAVCGMASVEEELRPGRRPLVAVTTVGITTQGAMRAVRVLEDAGYETIVFHAIGPGGRAMEQLMKEKIIGAVLDYSTIEVSNEMYHALLAGGPERLTTAGKLGLPQVICPGAIEVLVFNEPETVPLAYRDRTLIRHSPQITDVRLNKTEMAESAKKSLAACNIPLTPQSSWFRRPDMTVIRSKAKDSTTRRPMRLFLSELKADVPGNIRVIERDTHIEDPAFCD